MVEYTTSPVHMMSASELKMENYFGYTIAIITVISVALLIVGYQMTKDVAYCPCAQIYNGTDYGRTCIGEKALTQQQESECEDEAERNEKLYDDLKTETIYNGDCCFTFKHYENIDQTGNGLTDLTFECDATDDGG